MRPNDDKYECGLCGTLLDLPVEAVSLLMESASGQPTFQVLSVNGQEVHRCATLDGSQIREHARALRARAASARKTARALHTRLDRGNPV